MRTLLARLPSAALRSLRVQVTVALLIGAALCAYIANTASGDELAGAYREAGHEVLSVASGTFASEFRPEQLRRPAELERRAASLRRMDPEISSAVVVWPDPDDPRRLRSTPHFVHEAGLAPLIDRALTRGVVARGEVETPQGHFAEQVTPLGDPDRPVAALAISYDLRHYDALLEVRNQRVALVLGVLLLVFAAFTAFTLGRGIFRPLDQLRRATNQIRRGDLTSRHGWKRKDELGMLAADFDLMADELDEKHRRLEALALADPLTGLANHRRLQEMLVAEVERADQDGRPLSLLLLDLDHFGRINDTRGHPFGDQLLAAVGRRLADAVMGLGRAARLGADEFALLLPGADGERARTIAELVMSAVAKAPTEGYEISCSAGYATYPQDATNAAALFQLAYGALYWAKRSGRACIRGYDPEHVIVVTEEQREEFAAMISEPGMVTTAFQPIVALSTGEIVGWEALSRFADAQGRLPSWWFEQAHRFGLGHRLEAEAVSQALSVPGRPEGTFVSVNVSPSALTSPEITQSFPKDLSNVVIEVTEHEEITDEDGVRSALERLRARGAQVAIDDAGAGYASLRQVMRLRAEIVKLDRDLVQGVDMDSTKAALVASLVDFAQHTGASMCAEGIETIGELRTLRSLGVAYGQGYFLARPGSPWPSVRPEAARLIQRAAAQDVSADPIRTA